VEDEERERPARDKNPSNANPGDEPRPTAENVAAERDQEAMADDRVAAVRDLDADIDDFDAVGRDRAAESRDAEALERDRDFGGHGTSDAIPPLYAARRKARSDREDAAEDRAAAADDRERAHGDRITSQRHRERASEDRGDAHVALNELQGLLHRAEYDTEAMVTIGEAQALIMAGGETSPLEALLQLGARAATDHSELGAAAEAIVQDRAG